LTGAVVPVCPCVAKRDDHIDFLPRRRKVRGKSVVMDVNISGSVFHVKILNWPSAR
jgi:hypothetical protein